MPPHAAPCQCFSASITTSTLSQPVETLYDATQLEGVAIFSLYCHHLNIKVRDFAHEPQPCASKAPEVVNPLPALIATDWHMRNPEKNHGMLSCKALFQLIKPGWLSMAEVAKRVHIRAFTVLAQYSDGSDERRYPFVVVPVETFPTPSQRVRTSRNAGFRSLPDDLPDREFFGFDPPFGRRDPAGAAS